MLVTQAEYYAAIFYGGVDVEELKFITDEDWKELENKALDVLKEGKVFCQDCARLEGGFACWLGEGLPTPIGIGKKVYELADLNGDNNCEHYIEAEDCPEPKEQEPKGLEPKEPPPKKAEARRSLFGWLKKR